MKKSKKNATTMQRKKNKKEQAWIHGYQSRVRVGRGCDRLAMYLGSRSRARTAHMCQKS